VKILDDWIKYVTFRDGRFHFIIFSLVDAAMMLADIISNDMVGTAPRREKIYDTVKATRDMQGKLYCLSMSAKAGFRIIHKTVRRLLRTAPTGDLAFLPDEHEDDDGRGVLAAALESISLHAQKNESSVDAKNRVDPDTMEQQGTEILAEASAPEHGLQPVYTVTPLPSNHNDASAVSSGSMDSTLYECYTPTTSPNYVVAATAPPDYNGHMVSANATVAPSEYILSMPPNCTSSAPLNYTANVPSIHSAVTSSLVDPITYSFDEPVPLEYVEPASLSYSTAASLNDSAVTPAYIESALVGHDYARDVPSNHILNASLDYGTAPSSGSFTYTSPHVEPTLPMLGTSVFSGYNEVVPAVNFIANPEFFLAPTTYDTHASHLTYTDYDDAGFHTAYGPFSGPAPPQTFAPSTTPMAFTISPPYTSSETYNAPTMYSNVAPHNGPTAYASSATSFTPPETNTSPGYSENTAYTAASSNSRGTPESNDTPPADTTTINRPAPGRV
jgi:hypothetical protein